MSVLILQGNVSEIKDFGKVQCGDPPNIEKNSIISIYKKWRNWLIHFPMLGELWGTPSPKPAWNMDLSWPISHIWHKSWFLSDQTCNKSILFAAFHNWIPQKPWVFMGFQYVLARTSSELGWYLGVRYQLSPSNRASALLAPLPASASRVDRCWQYSRPGFNV